MAKINSYKEQLNCAESPTEKSIIKKKRDEAIHQVGKASIEL